MVGHIGIAAGAVFADAYEVRKILARGGMGSIYLATDRRNGQEIALKVLLPELVTDERMRQRFEREARVAAQLRSPYVPHVHDAGIDADGVPWIAMDLLKGRDLRQHIEAVGRLTLTDARAVLEQVAHALTEAHAHGLVHRDIKPENIYLDERDGQQRVKLLDFGVVKELDGNRTSATGTGAVGSPLWMAPEQTSAGGRIAPATDVWAFGLLTYYLITGRYYWKAASDDSGVAGLLRELHIDPIQPPSKRAREQRVDMALPVGFDDWFLTALQRDSTKRFRQAGAAWAALTPLLVPDPDEATTLAMETMPADVADTLSQAVFERQQIGLAADRASSDTVIDRGVSSDAPSLRGADSGTLQSLGGLPPSPFAGRISEAPARPAESAPPRPSTPSWGPPPDPWTGRPSAASLEPPRPSAPSLPSWQPPPSAPPPAPVPSIPPPSAPEGSRLPWILGLLAAGFLVSVITGLIVWIAMTMLRAG